ncbi:GNAT family N-acetyltransferase [Maribacter sp. 2210JD10-5]|uniref:GNAT family N-acetyltransferase n=1 Tax=Maribacter sp. 2210JD10-5 TaxID=3386272 RepID=UPI0039BD166E
MLKIEIKPLVPEDYETYIKVGQKAYNEHYRHLWPNGDTRTYIETSFTTEVLLKEEKDKNTSLYIIYTDGEAVGILKIIHDSPLKNFNSSEALLLDKIYILRAYSGKGIGRKILDFVTDKALRLNKKIVWLDTMQKGLALHFYLKNGFKMYCDSLLPFENAIEKEKPMYILTKQLE